jgi:glycosyltransferase involved in cell wall biosynthesis
MGASLQRVRIIHETDPDKYFPAVLELENAGRITIAGRHRYSVAKEWLRSGLKDRKPLKANTRASLRDLILRLGVFNVRGEVVILGFAPWDWRMAIYGYLARKNVVLYHTSWPYWDAQAVPRQYGPLTTTIRNLWIRRLSHPNVRVVAVLDASRIELRERYGIDAEVIPHAVPDVFYQSRNQSMKPPEMLRLIYVGGLWRKKGLERLFTLMDSLRGEAVQLTIVGDGTLRDRCIEVAAKNPAVRFLGPVRDRASLAQTMASHDVLVLLSQREPTWEELFGIVITEAMAAGLGVVASNHIGPRSLLEDADLGNLFGDDDLDGVLALIRQLASDQAVLRRFREAHSQLADEFRLASVADRWAEVIERRLPADRMGP